MNTIFKRLVRFKDADGHLFFGEALSDSLIGSEVQVYAGDSPWNLQETTQTAKISEVHLRMEDDPILEY